MITPAADSGAERDHDGVVDAGRGADLLLGPRCAVCVVVYDDRKVHRGGEELPHG